MRSYDAVIVALSLLSSALPSFAAVYTLPISRKALGSTSRSSNKYEQSKAETSASLVSFITLLDTGSSDLVVETAVQANSCTGCTTTGPLYNAAESTTAQVTTTPVVLVYGIGRDEGVAVTDAVTFGGFTLNQTFAACDVNEAFSNIGSTTALLGLGLQPLAQTNATPFVEALSKAGQLDAPEFGMALSFGNDNYLGDNLQGGGYITLGGVNETLFSGSIAYTDVFDGGESGYWAVPVTNIALNGEAAGGGTTAALIDSGTNGISLPTSLYTSIYTSLGGQYDSSLGSYIYPCSNTATLAFEIGGKWYNMSTKSFETQSSGGQCTGAVRDGGSGTSSALWILGSTFMESFMVSFRMSSPPAIGIATLADPNGALAAAKPPSTASHTRTGTAVGSSNTAAGSSSSNGNSGAAPRSMTFSRGALVVVGVLFVSSTALVL